MLVVGAVQGCSDVPSVARGREEGTAVSLVFLLLCCVVLCCVILCCVVLRPQCVAAPGIVLGRVLRQCCCGVLVFC